MKKFFAEQVESLNEMARAKNPEGVKTTRSKTYDKTHDIHIDGEHVGTISGTRANRFQGYRGAPHHLHVYRVYKNEEDMRNGWAKGDHGHPDHQETETRLRYHKDEHNNTDYSKEPDSYHVKVPKHYTSMEDAVSAIHTTHKNNKEFGAGHDPKVRWQHAIDHSASHRDHAELTGKYNTALAHAKALGHSDVIEALQNHADAHAATKPDISHDKLKQWTHDARNYVGEKYNYKTHAHEPTHPEHHALATAAHNVNIYGKPDRGW